LKKLDTSTILFLNIDSSPSAGYAIAIIHGVMYVKSRLYWSSIYRILSWL